MSRLFQTHFPNLIIHSFRSFEYLRMLGMGTPIIFSDYLVLLPFTLLKSCQSLSIQSLSHNYECNQTVSIHLLSNFLASASLYPRSLLAKQLHPKVHYCSLLSPDSQAQEELTTHLIRSKAKYILVYFHKSQDF